MKNFFKKYYRDIILILGVIICSIGTILIVRCTMPKEAVSATISQQNTVVLTIDLTKETENVREIPFPKSDVKMTIGVKKNAICVLRSDCPHQDCVNIYDEFCNYQWKTDKNGDREPEPIDAFNHLIDALRYSLEPLLQYNATKVIGLRPF